MVYVGIDVSKEKFDVMAIDNKATRLISPKEFQQNSDGFDLFDEELRKLSAGGNVKIGIESSGHYGVALWRFLLGKKWDTDVFNPVLTSQMNTNIRGRKTDKDDAFAIAKIVRDGDYCPLAVPQDDIEDLRQLCRQRRWDVEQLANSKKRLRSLVDQSFHEFSTLFSDPCGKGAFAVLKDAPSARLCAEINLKHLTHLLISNSHNRLNREKAKKIKETAKNSISFNIKAEGIEWSIKQMIEYIEHLQKMIENAEKEIEKYYDRVKIPIQSIPGLGKVTAPVILAELGDLDRFESKMAKKVLAYAGMEPRIRKSGKWTGKVKMSKRGSPTLRTALYQAANMARQHIPHLGEIYRQHKEVKQKHHCVAVSHVARKLVDIICAIHKTGQPFEMEKLCRNST